MDWCQSGLFTSKLLVKVAGIGATVLKNIMLSMHCAMNIKVTDNRGEVGWRNTLVQDVIKVDILEERMTFDLFGIGLS